ncbi:hypothetical protein NMY22_g14239 [Coprinellus aureogranulatus]|nr:hypothetical protein NMY22_g14239 [Coprinellus aureogranulatus]
MTSQLSEYRSRDAINTPAPQCRYRDMDDDDGGDQWADDLLGAASFEADCPRGFRSLQEEVDLYLSDQRPSIKNSLVFCEVPMDILPIQGSAVPCERVFSSAKETITPRRNRIRPKLMEALQMLKYSQRSGAGLDFTCGTSKEAETSILEGNRSDAAEVSSDYATYVNALGQDDDLGSNSEEEEEEYDEDDVDDE